MFRFNVSHVRLGDVDAPLKGSDFSIPRDELRLFGLVTLEVKVGKTSPEKVVRDLEALKYVEVEESKSEEGILLVMLEMPYNFTRDIFKELKPTSAVSAKSKLPKTSGALPRYEKLRNVVAEHQANLTDIRWGCRMLGCLAVPDAAKRQPIAAR
jgi:hypothetical protein